MKIFFLALLRGLLMFSDCFMHCFIVELIHLTDPFMSPQLVDCLDQPEVSLGAAQGFHVIMSENEAALSSAQHATIKFMYRQRFFHMVLPSILTRLQKAQSGKELTYLSNPKDTFNVSNLFSLSRFLSCETISLIHL